MFVTVLCSSSVMKCCCCCITLVAVLVGLADAQLNVVNFGNGIVYRRYATADTFLERRGSNYNYYDFLIVSKHPGYLKKRSLVILKTMCPQHAILHMLKCILTIGMPTKQVSIVYNMSATNMHMMTTSRIQFQGFFFDICIFTTHRSLSSLVDYKFTKSIKIGLKLKLLKKIGFQECLGVHRT